MRLQAELWKVLGKIRDEKFRREVERFLRKALRRLEEGGLSFFEAPAGKSHHHAYPGGLVQHTLSTVKLALAMADNLEKYYGFRGINRDYVVAGALLHDLYKPAVYQAKPEGGYEVSKLGNRLDHLTLLMVEAFKAKFPLDFLHVLAASHGEWGPMPPRTIEALIVHLADLADSRFAGEIQRAALNRLKAKGETPPPTITVKDAVKVLVEA